MTVPYLKEAALLEDIADELIQVHQALVVPDMMGENGEHHGVLWRQKRKAAQVVNIGKGRKKRRGDSENHV